jgi:hypothetical protein
MQILTLPHSLWGHDLARREGAISINCKPLSMTSLLTHNVAYSKTEFAEESTFFVKRFPSMRTFVNKKSWNSKKLKPTFKTDIIKVGLVF